MIGTVHRPMELAVPRKVIATSAAPREGLIADTKSMTLCLDRHLAEKVQTIAEVERSTVSNVIRDALAQHVERRRRDPEFHAMLRRNLQRHQQLLNLLADAGGDPSRT